MRTTTTTMTMISALVLATLCATPAWAQEDSTTDADDTSTPQTDAPEPRFTLCVPIVSLSETKSPLEDLACAYQQLTLATIPIILFRSHLTDAREADSQLSGAVVARTAIGGIFAFPLVVGSVDSLAVGIYRLIDEGLQLDDVVRFGEDTHQYFVLEYKALVMSPETFGTGFTGKVNQASSFGSGMDVSFRSTTFAELGPFGLTYGFAYQEQIIPIAETGEQVVTYFWWRINPVNLGVRIDFPSPLGGRFLIYGEVGPTYLHADLTATFTFDNLNERSQDEETLYAGFGVQGRAIVAIPIAFGLSAMGNLEYLLIPSVEPNERVPAKLNVPGSLDLSALARDERIEYFNIDLMLGFVGAGATVAAGPAVRFIRGSSGSEIGSRGVSIKTTISF